MTKDNYRIEGYAVYSSDKSIYLHNLVSGKEEKVFANISDSSIFAVKVIFIKKSLYCLVSSRDGKFITIDLKISL